MMDTQPYYALVVDDDPVARRMVGFALSQQGFNCAYAADGNDALDRLCADSFDLIVTDLRMPNRHGHSLIVELLSRHSRPLIVVHSSVDDPRLTKDLIFRGVDDVVFKPTNYAAFAAKAAGLVARARFKSPKLDFADSATEDEQNEQLKATSDTFEETACVSAPIGLSELQTQLADSSKVLPVSQAASNVFEIVLNESLDAEEVAKAIQLDSALAEQILELANSRFDSSSANRIGDIKQAVVRIGKKRVSEFALALKTLASLTPATLPWMDLDLAWRRSIAAGIAVELLVTQGDHAKISQGLLLSALLHDAGRMVLGTHYPKRYTELIAQCRNRNEPLVWHEAQMFPKHHAEVIVDLLSEWRIPTQLFEPLNQIGADYSALSKLLEPMRTKSELVRLAILIGQLAVGAWEDWELIDFPPTSLLDRLRIDDVQAVIKETKSQMQGVARLRAQPASSQYKKHPVQSAPARTAYCNFSPERFDFLALLLPSLGINAYSVDARANNLRGKVLVNRLRAVPDESPMQCFKDCDKILFVVDEANLKYAGDMGSAISVPCSFSAIRTAFSKFISTS